MNVVKEINTYWGTVYITLRKDGGIYGDEDKYKMYCYNSEFPRACFYYVHSSLESILDTLKEEHDKYVEVIENRIKSSEI